MAEEIFDVVSEDDIIIGQAPRSVVHSPKGHIHRSVMWFVFEFDPSGRVYVNQRSWDKEFYKGHWSIVLGGHVHSGETYEQAVARELPEETGLQGEPFYMADFRKRIDPDDRENVRVFGYTANREPELDRAEFVGGEYMTDGGLRRKLMTKRFLPETPRLLRILNDYRLI